MVDFYRRIRGSQNPIFEVNTFLPKKETTDIDILDNLNSGYRAGNILITPTGDISESEKIIDKFYGNIFIIGDTRELSGQWYADAVPIYTNSSNGGVGTCNLVNSGNDITVTGTTTNPDFDADGWGNGDEVIIQDNSYSTSTYTINSVSNNVITLTTTAPSVGTDTVSSMILKPNKTWSNNSTNSPRIKSYSCNSRIFIQGFYITDANINNEPFLDLYCNSNAKIKNCILNATSIYLDSSSVELEQVSMTIPDDITYSIYAINNSFFKLIGSNYVSTQTTGNISTFMHLDINSTGLYENANATFLAAETHIYGQYGSLIKIKDAYSRFTGSDDSHGVAIYNDSTASLENFYQYGNVSGGGGGTAVLAEYGSTMYAQNGIVDGWSRGSFSSWKSMMYLTGNTFINNTVNYTTSGPTTLGNHDSYIYRD